MPVIFISSVLLRFSVGFWSQHFVGQLSTVIPWFLNRVLIHLAVCAGGEPLWKNETSVSVKAAILTNWLPKPSDCGNFPTELKSLGFHTFSLFLKYSSYSIIIICFIEMHLYAVRAQGLWTLECLAFCSVSSSPPFNSSSPLSDIQLRLKFAQ